MIMSASESPGIFSQISSWVWALIVGFLAPILMIVPGEMLARPGRDSSIGEGISYLAGGTFIAVCCFLICRKNPRGAWYVPFICNAAGIFAACVEPNFWITPMWIWFAGGWVLTLAATIGGTQQGRRTAFRGTTSQGQQSSAKAAVRDQGVI
jgi:hypothetical protein